MEIREYTEYNEKEIIGLYDAVGWTAYTGDPEALRRGFGKSLLVLEARENGKLLGILRAVGDGETIVFVQDILVDPAHRLLQAALERYRHVRQVELVTDSTPETIAFYESIGFRRLADLGCTGFMRG